MRTLVTILVLLCLAPICARAEFNPFDGPKPIAIFIQTNPWSMVIGSDTPRVAIYENGDVIFAKTINKSLVYHHVTLDKAALDKVRTQISSVLTRKDLKPHYDIIEATDQPTASFYFRDGKQEFVTSVYGLTSGRKLPISSASKTAMPPEELLKLHKWFSELDFAKSKEWTPKYIEVMFWDYSYAPDSSISWPKDWPSLHSDRAIKHSDMYSVFLDSALLPKLRSFLAKCKEKGAVALDGKKMAASYRYTFPGEPLWRKAFEQEVKQ